MLMERFQNVLGKFLKRFGKVLVTVRTCLQNVDGTFPKHSRNILKCFRKVMLMFKKHLGKVYRTLMELFQNVLGTFLKYFGKVMLPDLRHN